MAAMVPALWVANCGWMTSAWPIRAAAQARQDLEHVERELEPVALLGVDGEVEVGGRSEVDQPAHARHELGKHAQALRLLVAREQRRELDRDAVAARRVAAIGAGARRGRSPARGDRADGVEVGVEVALGVALGACALAEHVVAEDEPGLAPPRFRRFLQCLADRPAEHELAAEQLDRAHGRGDDGLRPEPAQQTGLGFGVGQEALRQRDRARRQGRHEAVR
jgi:hypothetical protein